MKLLQYRITSASEFGDVQKELSKLSDNLKNDIQVKESSKGEAIVGVTDYGFSIIRLSFYRPAYRIEAVTL